LEIIFAWTFSLLATVNWVVISFVGTSSLRASEIILLRLFKIN